MRRVLAAFTVVLGMLAGGLLLGAPAQAHPLGELTASRYDGLVVGVDRVSIEHVEDLAEIPTAQVTPEIDVDGDGTLAIAELGRYARRACAAAASDLRLTVGGTARPVRLSGVPRARVGDGRAGLPVLRLECPLSAAVPALRTPTEYSFADAGGAGSSGWREITVVGDRTSVTGAAVRADSASRKLTRYPEDALSSPPDLRSVTFSVRPGGAAAVPDAGSAPDSWAPASDRVTRLLDSSTTPWLAAVAVLAAAVLGAAHALAPGHGKTVMAFYLLARDPVRVERPTLVDRAARRSGSRPVRAAFAVGAAVTVAHTAGVLTLGLLVSGGVAVAPAAVMPWLSAASGLLIVLVGVALLRGARHGRSHSHGPDGHSHSHGPGHGQAGGHDHGHGQAGGHDHGHGHTHAHPTPARGRLTLVATGLAGGLLPSPSALLVFLGAVAADRAWFGVVLVLSFGVGMAATLAAAGLLVRFAGQRVVRLVTARAGRIRSATLARLVTTALRKAPVLTGVGVCGVGATIAVRALVAI
ncbi:nickel transporter [Cryptosporangium minutisporangium]|uniref:Nickel transporter n=1 Tax=Cryptosporangium minutisporangium TaxID=113569 RepID=A0ABP6T896_9ACTN